MNIARTDNESKLTVYLTQTGIKDTQKAREIIQTHFSEQARSYPYVLFRNNCLYLFSVSGLSSVEFMRTKKNGVDYLRFDGERITQLEEEYYLGPRVDNETNEDNLNFESNNNNNNNNNNNG
jgi:hypothetical protein